MPLKHRGLFGEASPSHPTEVVKMGRQPTRKPSAPVKSMRVCRLCFDQWNLEVVVDLVGGVGDVLDRLPAWSWHVHRVPEARRDVAKGKRSGKTS